MVGHCYPQNILESDFCGELSFSFLFTGSILPQQFTCIDFLWIMRNSKQRLKVDSVLKNFVVKLPSCQKIREAPVVYGLKRYLIIYP